MTGTGGIGETVMGESKTNLSFCSRSNFYHRDRDRDRDEREKKVKKEKRSRSRSRLTSWIAKKLQVQLLMDTDSPLLAVYHVKCLLTGPDQERKVRRKRNQTKKGKRSQGEDQALIKKKLQVNIHYTAHAGRGVSQRRTGTSLTHLPK